MNVSGAAPATRLVGAPARHEPLHPSSASSVQLLMFAELQRVRLIRDVASEGYCLRGGLVVTVVSVYGGGKAYAVKFANVNGEITVVTVEAEVLEYIYGICGCRSDLEPK